MFLSKEAKKAIGANMPKEIRNRWKKGNCVMVTIKVHKPLKRWGDTCLLILRKNQILSNNLVMFAWNNDIEKAKVEAANAIDFFVYDDFKLTAEA